MQQSGSTATDGQGLAKKGLQAMEYATMATKHPIEIKWVVI
jgi:hypothetical protein